jgi:hypothetical protein
MPCAKRRSLSRSAHIGRIFSRRGSPRRTFRSGSSPGVLTRRRSSLGNRGGFDNWLVNEVAQRALVVKVRHGMTFKALAELSRVGFAKRTRNINRPQFSHAPNVIQLRSRVYTRSKPWLGGRRQTLHQLVHSHFSAMAGALGREKFRMRCDGVKC